MKGDTLLYINIKREEGMRKGGGKEIRESFKGDKGR